MIVVIILATCFVKIVEAGNVANLVADRRRELTPERCPPASTGAYLHFHTHCIWLVFVNLKQTRGIWGEGTSSEELRPSNWPVCKSIRHCLN